MDIFRVEIEVEKTEWRMVFAIMSFGHDSIRLHGCCGGCYYYTKPLSIGVVTKEEFRTKGTGSCSDVSHWIEGDRVEGAGVGARERIREGLGRERAEGGEGNRGGGGGSGGACQIMGA